MPDSIAKSNTTIKPFPSSAHHGGKPVSQSDSAYYAPGYPAGLPDSIIPLGRKAEQLSELPVMTKSVGKSPEGYIVSPVHSSGMLILLTLAFLLVAFCYRTGGKYFKSIIPDLWSVKREDSLEPHTSSETITMVALILQSLIMEGLIVYCSLLHYAPSALPGSVDAAILLLIAAAGCYYSFQATLLRLIGIVFAKRAQTAMWIRGLNAAQSLLGQLLAPVALAMLFLPEYNEQLFITASGLYVITRLSFLIKSFRLFFQNIFQCVYFILYLCSVEIIPVILSFKYVLLIPNLLENSLL